MINYILNQFVLQECGDFTWRVSDCEELVGVITGDDGGGRLLREGDSNETI